MKFASISPFSRNRIPVALVFATLTLFTTDAFAENPSPAPCTTGAADAPTSLVDAKKKKIGSVTGCVGFNDVADSFIFPVADNGKRKRFRVSIYSTENVTLGLAAEGRKKVIRHSVAGKKRFSEVVSVIDGDLIVQVARQGQNDARYRLTVEPVDKNGRKLTARR